MSSVSWLVLVPLIVVGPRGADTPGGYAPADYEEVIGFISDGGVLSCPLGAVRPAEGERDVLRLLIVGPPSLKQGLPKEIQLGVKFSRPVTIGELMGDRAKAPPHARAGMKAGDLCDAPPATWNEFLRRVSEALAAKRVVAFRAIAAAPKPGAAATLREVHPLGSTDVLENQRKP